MRAALVALTCVLELLNPTTGLAAEAKKAFDITAGEALPALKQFVIQSGQQLLYSAEAVQGVTTQAVKGTLTAREALGRMVDGTKLTVVADRKNGALSLVRDPGPNAPRVAQMEATTQKNQGKIEDGKVGQSIKLEKYEVLGTRIRQSDSAGPTPVNSYTAEDIRASGAMSLADFFAKVPQVYGGIGAGRGSAPSDYALDAGQRNENQLPVLQASGVSPVLASNAPVQTGVSGVSLRSLGSGSTLVLVDGRRVAQSGNGNRGSAVGQGFVDLNTIPIGLVERIEMITDGASAIYGADAVAGVINIILKKDWQGVELSGSIKFPQHGGARERQSTVTAGFARGRLRGSLSLTYYDRAPLFASERSISAAMDHRSRVIGFNASGNPLFGTDQRIQFGYPASVQAIPFGGSFTALPGISVALAPSGATSTPALSAFQPVTTNAPGQTSTVIIAQGQRTSNVTDWMMLIAEAERSGVTANLNYAVAEGLEIYATGGRSESKSFAQGLPAYVATPTNGGFAATNFTVPAAYNPFGQNVAVGMLLPGFGALNQRTETITDTITTGMRGKFGQSWSWDAGYRWQEQDFSQVNRSFNPAAFNASLSNADASLRFNPFVDERISGAPKQSALLETFALYPTVDAISSIESIDFTANGELFQLWGGPVRSALGASYDRTRSRNTAVNFSAAATPVRTVVDFVDARNTKAFFGELAVPVFGKPNARPLLQRLELTVAGRRDDFSDAGSSSVPKYGFSWVPVKTLLFRGSYSEGFRPPSLAEDRVATANNTTFVQDPLRGNTLSSFTMTRQTNPNLRPETSTNRFYGAVWEPAFATGLTLQANYYDTVQRDAIQVLSLQAQIINANIFPGTVVRNAPSATDLANGWPGSLSRVFSQAVNFGTVRNESMDLIAEYRLPWEQYGRWRISLNAANTLKATRELSPGIIPVDDMGDTYAGPKWNTVSSLYWSRGSWNAMASWSHLSGFARNTSGVRPSSLTVPAVGKADVRVGYEFKSGVWRHYGRGLMVNVGVANLFDKEPPFVDTIYGFNAGLHGLYVFGRTLELSFVLPIK